MTVKDIKMNDPGGFIVLDFKDIILPNPSNSNYTHSLKIDGIWDFMHKNNKALIFKNIISYVEKVSGTGSIETVERLYKYVFPTIDFIKNDDEELNIMAINLTPVTYTNSYTKLAIDISDYVYLKT